MDATSKSANRLPRHQPIVLVLGLLSIISIVSVTALMNAATVVTIVATIAVSFVVGTILIMRETHRGRWAQQVVHEEQIAVNQWQQKWQALQAEARQTATALAQMLDGLIMVSPSGVILLINESARRMLSLSNDNEILGRRLAEVIRIPAINGAVNSVNNGRSHQVITVEIIDGAVVRPLRVQVNRITQGDDKRLLLMFRDETETRRVEEMRREFIANVSHELKTPLAAIKGYAETVELAVEDDPDAAAHFMRQIHTQCLRLERLVADMMQLARAQSGAHLMKITNVNLQRVVTDALTSCRPLAEAKSIKLMVDDFDEAAVVLADQEALLTIANNLIGNAIRYTPDGGNVCVSCRYDSDRWALVVADDGIGIPISDQERIFERFYRVDKARESDDGGTGIGLSIVKNLAVALGGEVGVTSQPQKGATFEVRLRPATATADADNGDGSPPLSKTDGLNVNRKDSVKI